MSKKTKVKKVSGTSSKPEKSSAKVSKAPKALPTEMFIRARQQSPSTPKQYYLSFGGRLLNTLFPLKPNDELRVTVKNGSLVLTPTGNKVDRSVAAPAAKKDKPSKSSKVSKKKVKEEVEEEEEQEEIEEEDDADSEEEAAADSEEEEEEEKAEEEEDDEDLLGDEDADSEEEEEDEPSDEELEAIEKPKKKKKKIKKVSSEAPAAPIGISKTDQLGKSNKELKSLFKKK